MQQTHVSLSDQSRAIILGSLLGDGSLRIQHGYKEARFSFRHSIHQKEYFCWKARALQEITAYSSIFPQPADGYGGDKLRFQSRAHPGLTELFRLTHKNNILRIRRTWLNQMTPLSLAIWWLDDGSIIGNGRKGVFCTDGFDEESVKLLAQYLKVVWKIQAHVAPIQRIRDGVRHIYYRLWLRSSEELQKFLQIILPSIPVAEVLPKVLLLYKDSQLQQRWISEVIEKTKFDRSLVQHYLDAKKSRWKHYRE